MELRPPVSFPSLTGRGHWGGFLKHKHAYFYSAKAPPFGADKDKNPNLMKAHGCVHDVFKNPHPNPSPCEGEEKYILYILITVARNETYSIIKMIIFPESF